MRERRFAAAVIATMLLPSVAAAGPAVLPDALYGVGIEVPEVGEFNPHLTAGGTFSLGGLTVSTLASSSVSVFGSTDLVNANSGATAIMHYSYIVTGPGAPFSLVI